MGEHWGLVVPGSNNKPRTSKGKNPKAPSKWEGGSTCRVHSNRPEMTGNRSDRNSSGINNTDGDYGDQDTSDNDSDNEGPKSSESFKRQGSKLLLRVVQGYVTSRTNSATECTLWPVLEGFTCLLFFLRRFCVEEPTSSALLFCLGHFFKQVEDAAREWVVNQVISAISADMRGWVLELHRCHHPPLGPPT